MQLERMDEKQRELEEREYREKILHAIENPSPRKLSKYPRKVSRTLFAEFILSQRNSISDILNA